MSKTGIYKISITTNNGGWNGSTTKVLGYYRDLEKAALDAVIYMETQLSASIAYVYKSYSRFKTWEEYKDNLLNNGFIYTSCYLGAEDVYCSEEEIEVID